MAKILLSAHANPNNRAAHTQETDFQTLLTKLYEDSQLNGRGERAIVHAFLACGADYSLVSDDCIAQLVLGRPQISHLILNFEENRVALFKYIEMHNFKAIRVLAKMMPFKCKNAQGDNPLQFAIKTGHEFDRKKRKKTILVVKLLLRILHRPFMNELDGEGNNPIFLAVKHNRSSVLKCFTQAALGATKDGAQ